MLFVYRVDGVPCGIGTFVPSQLVIHTVFLFALLFFYLCLLLLHVYSVPCGIGTSRTQSVGYTHILSLCLFVLLFIVCASNVPCGIGDVYLSPSQLIGFTLVL